MLINIDQNSAYYSFWNKIRDFGKQKSLSILNNIDQYWSGLGIFAVLSRILFQNN